MRLDRLLRGTHNRLAEWAEWGAAFYANRFPALHPIICGASSAPRVEWPAPIVVLDENVLSLAPRLGAAVLANYMTAGDRAVAYAALMRQFAAAREGRPIGTAAFRHDLDRAR